MRRILYFDASSGVSGDMFVGALIDAGACIETVQNHIAALNVEGIEVLARKVRRGGKTGTKFDVLDPETGRNVDETTAPVGSNHHSPVHHRGLKDITRIIVESPLPEAVKEDAIGVFRLLANAEAKVHNSEIEQVHFHEVGALDSIADIVGAASAFNQLEVSEVWCSPVHVGSGTVQCAHGVLPVPAPATRELLESIPAYSTAIQGELATPTGVALLKYFCTQFAPMPVMIIEKVGFGAGTKDFGIPNLLQARIGKIPAEIPERPLLPNLFL